MKLSTPESRARSTHRVNTEITRCDELARRAWSKQSAFDALCGQDLIFASDSLKRIWGMSNAEILAMVNTPMERRAEG